jgi:hypothetical protein
MVPGTAATLHTRFKVGPVSGAGLIFQRTAKAGASHPIQGNRGALAVASCSSVASVAGEDSFNLLPVILGDQPDDQPIRPPVVVPAMTGVMSIRSGPWKLIDGPSAPRLTPLDDTPATGPALATTDCARRQRSCSSWRPSCGNPIPRDNAGESSEPLWAANAADNHAEPPAWTRRTRPPVYLLPTAG